MNKVELIGRLTKDPVVRYTTNTQMAVARFSLAVNRGKGSDGQYKTDFISIVCFGKVAEHVERYLSKGRQCGITGRIQTGYYDKDGERVYTTDVVAETVEFLGKKPENAPESTTADDIPEGFAKLDDDDIPF